LLEDKNEGLIGLVSRTQLSVITTRGLAALALFHRIIILTKAIVEDVV
jgi:hypothetical protein